MADWSHVRARASLKAFTTVKNQITNGQLRYDDRTSLSDNEWDDQSSGNGDDSCSNKPIRKPNLDDADKAFFTSLPSCYARYFAFDSNDKLSSYCPFLPHNRVWRERRNTS